MPDLFFFFNDTPTTEIYTLSLHDALPICERLQVRLNPRPAAAVRARDRQCPRYRRHPNTSIPSPDSSSPRSEEHTSELQSRQYLVCRLLLEKKKNLTKSPRHTQSSLPSRH